MWIERLLIGLFGVALLACGITEAESFPLSLTLRAEPATVSAGETVNVRAEARGQSLVWIVLEYGDTGVDTFLTVGNEGAISGTHRYDVPGEKVLRATVRDAELGEQQALATVQVTDSAGS